LITLVFQKACTIISLRVGKKIIGRSSKNTFRKLNQPMKNNCWRMRVPGAIRYEVTADPIVMFNCHLPRLSENVRRDLTLPVFYAPGERI